MKSLFQTLIGFLLFSPLLCAQSDISGIINDYAHVFEIDTCLGSLRLEDISAFQTGDRVLLIQMKGATILESDNADFGTLTDLGMAGVYEKGTITAIAGNEVLLENNILFEYDLGGNVQLVRIPQYQDARVVDTIKGLPWNGQTGGIIALEVLGQLEFADNAVIDATGIGFRGGTSLTNLPNDCSWFNQQNDYYYDLNSWRGAEKGEGIADYINGKEAGKGPQANGGGGGNDHNSGGGGGAHLAQGGAGGKNEEPSTFGCKGNHPGLGGKPIDVLPGERVFMGGGGGAGHSNNNVGTDGGRGGGIILITADRIANNLGQVSFLSLQGASPELTKGDGAGGGGAGGTLLIEANTIDIQGEMIIDAQGGDGGRIDNQSQARCHGPGGGGSGGSGSGQRSGFIVFGFRFSQWRSSGS